MIFLYILNVISRSAENGDISSDLVNILSECQQEVPDFIANGGSGGAGMTSQGFGGVDIRGGNAVETNAAVDDEDW